MKSLTELEAKVAIDLKGAVIVPKISDCGAILLPQTMQNIEIAIKATAMHTIILNCFDKKKKRI